MTPSRVGAAKVRRQLEQPSGRFSLRAGLSAPGALPLSEAQALVLADWQRQVLNGTVGAGVIRLYSGDVRRFVRAFGARGVTELHEVTPDHVIVWMHAANRRGESPSSTSVSRRMAAVRAFFTTCICLGLHNLNPGYSVSGSRPVQRFVSPLRTEQIAQLQRIAPFRLGETKTPAALALLLLGATSREAAFVRVMDVDLAGSMVWLHDGGERTRPRWVYTDDPWILQALTTRINHLRRLCDDDSLATTTIAYTGTQPVTNPVRRQAAVGVGITALMRKARIYQPGRNRVESIREAVALHTFCNSGGSLVAVATQLGLSSLDNAAHLVGYDWVAAHGIARPAPVEPVCVGGAL